MSFRIQPAAPARPNRCQLFGPGSRPALFEKMAASAADVINLDLEDSVAPDDKPQARANIIAGDQRDRLGQKDPVGADQRAGHALLVSRRGRGAGTGRRPRIDQIMIPKVGCAADVYAVDALVTAMERAKGRTKADLALR